MFFGLGAQELIILAVLCALAVFSLCVWAVKRPDGRASSKAADRRPDHIRPTALGRWFSLRRIGFIFLAWIALGFAAMNAAKEPDDSRVAVFIGGALWSVIFLAIAFWPRRAQQESRSERREDER